MLDEATIKNVIDRQDVKYFEEYVWKDYKNVKIEDGYNLLQYAIYNSSVDIVEFILKKKYYDINFQSATTNETAIVIAMDDFTDESVEIAEMIFKYYPDVDVDIPNKYGRNAVLTGMFSGINNRYIILAAERTKNLEQVDTEMQENVVDACIRNSEMYRTYAQILTIYINKGANISKNQLFKILGLIGDSDYSSVKQALEKREDLADDIIYLASEGGFTNFLPQTAKDMFLF